MEKDRQINNSGINMAFLEQAALYCWSVRPGLRWNRGVLEQAWQNDYTGEVKWEPVPQFVELSDAITDKATIEGG